MAVLEWDKTGERRFDAGIRKGVLYPPGECGVPWNGLTSVDEKGIVEVEPVIFDGVKYDDIETVGDFSATLKAFTYPDEFLEFEGTPSDQDGFLITGQPLKRFGLSYQTTCGDDVHGRETGYKIHLLWNLIAIPADKSFQTIGDSVEALEFEWDLMSIPEEIEGYRPTAHIILDSRKLDPYLLADIEAILYGENIADLEVVDHGDGTWSASSSQGAITMIDDTTFQIVTDSAKYLNPNRYEIWSSEHCAHLPSLQALGAFIRTWNRLIIVDNGNGTWTATSPIEGVINMDTPTKFSITTDSAEYLDPDTYNIWSSDKNEGDVWL